MKKVLFLDDNTNRKEYAYTTLYAGESLELCSTAAACIQAMKSHSQPWDIVSLDHDLGGAVFVDSNREDCGMEVVRWAVENKPSVREFIVHSWNTPAAYEMAKKLSDAGYAVILEPFSVAQ